jgi:hypothetical protein
MTTPTDHKERARRMRWAVYAIYRATGRLPVSYEVVHGGRPIKVADNQYRYPDGWVLKLAA